MAVGSYELHIPQEDSIKAGYPNSWMVYLCLFQGNAQSNIWIRWWLGVAPLMDTSTFASICRWFSHEQLHVEFHMLHHQGRSSVCWSLDQPTPQGDGESDAPTGVPSLPDINCKVAASLWGSPGVVGRCLEQWSWCGDTILLCPEEVMVYDLCMDTFFLVFMQSLHELIYTGYIYI